MRLICTSDLHGSMSSYRHLFELAVTHHAQAVIIAGDLLPHAIKLAHAIEAQRDFITHFLRPLLTEVRATHPDLAVYLLAGNDDWAAAITALDDLERDGLAFPLHERVFALSNGLWVAGYACVPITPFSIKDFERYDGEGDIPGYSFAMAYTSTSGQPVRTSLSHLLRQPSVADALAGMAQRSDPTRTVYIFHAPPGDTALDLVRGRHRGSQAVRSFIERYQPPLTLHGHIHESPRESGRYVDRLGRTWCINAGQDGVQLHATILDTDDIDGTLWHTIYGYAAATDPTSPTRPPAAAEDEHERARDGTEKG